MPTPDPQKPQQPGAPDTGSSTTGDESSPTASAGPAGGEATSDQNAADQDTADQTIADQTVVGGSPSSSAAAESPAGDVEQTLMDPSLAEPPLRAAGQVVSRPPEADDRTIVQDTGFVESDPVPGTIPADQTLMDAERARPDRIPSDADQTIVEETGDPGQTLADADLPDRAVDTDQAADTDDRTLADHTQADHTQAVSGSPAETDSDRTLADDRLSSRSADATQVDATQVDATQVDATQVDAGPADDPDGTIVEGASGTDTDATQVDGAGSSGGFDQTMVEESFDAGAAGTGATSVEQAARGGDFGETAVAGDGGKPSRDSGTRGTRPRPAKQPARKRRPGTHETADRWETQQRYQLISNFARGGLGQIWLAQDGRLRREVAYKELLPAVLKNRNALERFLEEAQITGQLEHPGIVPIYDIGYQQNGAPFYAMKLVRGETMEKHIEALHELPRDSPEFSLTFRRLLRSFIDICNAIAFAHDRGVLHRDLKPLNVMLGAFGETLVLDWGLAKVLDIEVTDEDAAPITTDSGGGLSVDGQTVLQTSDGSSQTGATQGATAQSGATQSGASQGATAMGASPGGRTQMSGTFGTTRRMVVTDVRSVGSQTMMGSVMGTPAYMPPEQGRGDLDELDARSDIYSLGGILYKLLTNQQPIPRGKIREVLKNVTEGNIIPPRTHDAGVPRPLEAVCLKALSKNKEDRYASALDLARDIEAWLGDEPVSCFEDPWTVKARRWAKRHRTAVATALGTTAAVLVMWSAAAWNHAARMNDIRDFARTSLSQAETAAAQLDFGQSRELLTAAIGRVTGEDDLVDLLGSLESRLSLLESDRVRRLERDVEADLTRARAQLRGGAYENARTLLAELQVRLQDETRLPELKAAVDREIASADQAIARAAAVAQTEERFSRFLELCDAARARGSLQTMDNVDDDAKLARKHAADALELFGLNTDEPFARTPRYFDGTLPWTRRRFERTGRWPLDELKSGTLELLLISGDMEVQLARNLDETQQQAAAERALELIARAKTIGLESVALLGNESLWLQLAGRDDEARRVLTAAARLKPSTSLDFYLLAEAERKSKNFQQALELYQRAQQLSPTSYWPQHFTGLCHMQLGEVQAALACFTNCISLREDYAWPRMLRGVCNGQLQRIDAALADFDAAEKLDPDLYNIPVNRGVVLTVAGRFAEAISQFERASALAPDAAQPHINRAMAHFQVAQRIADAEPPFDGLSDLERLQQEQARYGQALDALAVAASTERAPDHPGIHQLRGRIEERSGNTQAALASYRRHLQVEPDGIRRAFTLHRIGRLHFQLREFDQALAAFEQAHQLKPTDGRIVRDLAETHLQLRDAAKAQQRFHEYLTLVNADIAEHLEYPDLVFNGMATAENLQRRKREANDYYTLSLMFNPEQAGVLSQRGWLLLTDGLQLAKADFEASVARNGRDPHTLIGLALTQTRLGDWQAALKTMKTALPIAAEQAEQVGPQAFALFHNAATVYAQCLIQVEQDPRLNAELRRSSSTVLYRQIEQLLRRSKQVARPSAAMLRAMKQALRTESEFSELRSRPEFLALLRDLLDETDP